MTSFSGELELIVVRIELLHTCFVSVEFYYRCAINNISYAKLAGTHHVLL